MKKLLQYSLFLILILITISFYLVYFQNFEKDKPKIVDKELSQSFDGKNNIIKNLRYNINFDNNTEYMITADFSELVYENDMEIVFMKGVKAVFKDENNFKLNITSENAIYNNSNYNTNFSKNIKIEYMSNIIYSEELNLNFEENIVKIYDNVVYEGLQGKIMADNIIINMITKNVDINMENLGEKVKITAY